MTNDVMALTMVSSSHKRLEFLIIRAPAPLPNLIYIGFCYGDHLLLYSFLFIFIYIYIIFLKIYIYIRFDLYRIHVRIYIFGVLLFTWTAALDYITKFFFICYSFHFVFCARRRSSKRQESLIKSTRSYIASVEVSILFRYLTAETRRASKHKSNNRFSRLWRENYIHLKKKYFVSNKNKYITLPSPNY